MSTTKQVPEAVSLKRLTLNVNDMPYTLVVEPHWTLSEVLRDHLGLTGTKQSCNDGACGSCTVICNGEAILSCHTLAIECEGKNIETVEGLIKDGKLHPLQKAFAASENWLQCGVCAPGMIMSAKALLDKNPTPTEEEIRMALSSNICRCGNYERATNAVMQVVKGEIT